MPSLLSGALLSPAPRLWAGGSSGRAPRQPIRSLREARPGRGSWGYASSTRTPELMPQPGPDLPDSHRSELRATSPAKTSEGAEGRVPGSAAMGLVRHALVGPGSGAAPIRRLSGLPRRRAQPAPLLGNGHRFLAPYEWGIPGLGATASRAARAAREGGKTRGSGGGGGGEAGDGGKRGADPKHTRLPDVARRGRAGALGCVGHCGRGRRGPTEEPG